VTCSPYRYRIDLVRRLTYTERRVVAGVTTLNNKIFIVYYYIIMIIMIVIIIFCCINCSDVQSVQISYRSCQTTDVHRTTTCVRCDDFEQQDFHHLLLYYYDSNDSNNNILLCKLQ